MVQGLKDQKYIFLSLFIYFESERARAGEEQRERGGERKRERKNLSVQSLTRLELTNHEIMT